MARVDLVALLERKGRRLAGLQDHERRARPEDAPDADQPRLEILEVADAERHEGAVEGAVFEREVGGVALDERHAAAQSLFADLHAPALQHPVRDVDPDHLVGGEGEGLDGEVAGPGRHVEQALRATRDGVRQERHGALAPADVDAEREDAVERVVARGDGVEHGLDVLALAGSLADGRFGHEIESRGGRTVPRRAGRGARSW